MPEIDWDDELLAASLRRKIDREEAADGLDEGFDVEVFDLRFRAFPPSERRRSEPEPPFRAIAAEKRL